MSTLNFDSLNNQNHLTGLNRSEQCWNSSNLYADPSVASSSYGSGQYGTNFGEQYVLEEKYCTAPSLYNPVVSVNNNSRTPNVPSTSSVCEEDLDDEEADGILSNLPSSCQDFEAKEMHIRLERNQSSPLVTDHVSPAHSSKFSSGCPSVEPPHEPADPDDLEVQWINESFEEQQKATLMYQSGDLKTLFYHGSDHESSKAPTRSSTEKSVCSPVERPERLPYVKKLLSQDSSSSLHEAARPATPPRPVKQDQTFEPLLTPKSEALIQQQVQKKSNFKNRRVSEPLARKPPIFWSAPDFTNSTDSLSVSSNDVFDVGDPILPEASRHVSFAPEVLRTPVNRAVEEVAADDRTEELAKGIVESLFVGWTPTEAVAEPFPVVPEGRGVARKLNMDPVDEPKSEETPVVPAVAAEEAEDDGDSWDTMDDDQLSKQMEELKLASEAASKKQLSAKKGKDYSAPPVVWNHPALAHVLEAYNIPDYKLYEDVVAALESLGYSTATVKWIERKIVFIAFETEKNAQDVLILKKHPWLNMRALGKSPPEVQAAALSNERILRPPKTRPKTHTGVARRMVENALGVKANVSREKKAAEQKELRDAKAAKKTAVNWDD